MQDRLYQSVNLCSKSEEQFDEKIAFWLGSAYNEE